MSKRIIPLIKEIASGFECFPCERINLDQEKFLEYQDSDEHPAEKPFEFPEMEISKKKVLFDFKSPTIMRYFLDGSRKTYKIAEIIFEGHYLPLIAGQVGVAVLYRDELGHLIPKNELCQIKYMIAFPNLINDEDLNVIHNEIIDKTGLDIELHKYQIKEGDKDLVDLGVAKIMKEMHDLEVNTVEIMANNKLLDNTSILIVDGPLRFKNKFDISQFRNVIGLSKSFRPSFSVGKGRKKIDVGSITVGLNYSERTSTFKTEDGNKIIGMWYLRIRKPNLMSEPLQGIVKMECYATSPEEIENGFDADRVDNISSHLLKERNVTPYSTDNRWASHIYPIYLAEKYIKTSFMSDIKFKALF